MLPACLLVPMLPACLAAPNPTVRRYAGSHGFDIGRGLSDSDFGYTIASSYQPAMDEALEQLAALLADVEGLVIEDNTFSISIHYRNVDEAIRPQVDLAVQEVQSSVVRAVQCSELQYSADFGAHSGCRCSPPDLCCARRTVRQLCARLLQLCATTHISSVAATLALA